MNSISGTEQEVEFIEELDDKRAFRKNFNDIRKKIVDQFKKSGELVEIKKSGKTYYILDKKDITEWVVDYQNNNDEKIFEKLNAYYSAFAPHHWTACRYLKKFSEFDDFTQIYSCKLFQSMKNFDSSKRIRKREWIYQIDKLKWKCIVSNEFKKDQNGNYVKAAFNDYYFTAIFNMISSEKEKSRNSKNTLQVFCQICGEKIKKSAEHIKKHNITVEEYEKKYPQKSKPTIVSIHAKGDIAGIEEIYTSRPDESIQDKENVEQLSALFKNPIVRKIVILKYFRNSVKEISAKVGISENDVKRYSREIHKNKYARHCIKSSTFI